MQDTHARTRLRGVIAAVMVLALLVAGLVWYQRSQEAARERACVAAFEYTLWLDQQGYTGPIQDPTYLRNRDRCLS